MLLEIKKFLSEKKTANLQQIAWHVKQNPELVRDMLQHFIRKGKVVKAPKPNGCGSRCVQCKPEFAEVYCWNSYDNIDVVSQGLAHSR